MLQRIVYSILLFFNVFSVYAWCREIGESIKMGTYSDKCIYDNGHHSAFTCLTEYKGSKYLAFREGIGHRPINSDNYGVITILREKDSVWTPFFKLSHPKMDLRDPFFLVIQGNLRIYCGYNQFVDGHYQHSGTVYSDLTEDGWSEFRPINHDVPHVLWLWKIRQFHDEYYGVGYLEGETPVLLSSTDGLNWKTVINFALGGVLSEADLCFVNDTMCVCLRQDIPYGSPSWWGIAKYPFTEFKWAKMSVSIASPDMQVCYNRILLAGRQYTANSDIRVSIFESDLEGNVNMLYSHACPDKTDKGYPSILISDNDIYMSYYEGSARLSEVRLSRLFISGFDE